MTIRFKTALGITREGVEPAILNGGVGWVRQRRDIYNFYPSTKWEPVEEWVDIQVNKKDWDSLMKYVTYQSGMNFDTICGVKWRYPQ